MSYRRFDANTKKWSVHVAKLPQVVAAGRKFFDHVDYRSLPGDLQIKIVKFLEDATEESLPHSFNIQKRPHAVLFVMENAPEEVIKAAYKALAAKHHPDHDGDPEVFMEIQDAYEKLMK
jgi:DnaJ-class molecular chaperone